MLEQSGPMSFPRDGNERNADFEGDSFWFAHRQRCLVTAMRAFDPGPVFVDIGGGTGFVSAAVKRDLGKHVVLIEPDPAGGRLAKQRGVEEQGGRLSKGRFELLQKLFGDGGGAGAQDTNRMRAARSNRLEYNRTRCRPPVCSTSSSTSTTTSSSSARSLDCWRPVRFST